MSRLVAALGAVLLLATVASAGDAPPAPRIRVEPESFDFGEAALELESVSTTCGCTAALAGARRIEPGRSTPLAVTLQTRRYSGKVERRVLIRSNDPKTPLLELRLRATVGEGTARK